MHGQKKKKGLCYNIIK